MVAWDKDTTGGPKCFGLYPSPNVFVANLLSCEEDKRWAYELIPPNTRCKAYTDIEWKEPGPLLPGFHPKMNMILDHLSQKTLKEHGIIAIFQILTSSRKDEDGLIKHSYHVNIVNLLFENNHDGTMKHFFEVTDDMGDDWFWNKKGEILPILDPKVYTNKQKFRMPLCSKKGKTIPLLPLDGNFGGDDVGKIISYLVTSIDPNIDYKLVPCTQSKPNQIKVKSGSTPAKTVQTGKFQFTGHQLEDILRKHGDLVSKVTKITPDQSGDFYRVQCDQRKQKRKCLHETTCFHNSNNCLLRVTPEGTQFRVDYRCMGGKCQNLRDLCLGYIQQTDEGPVDELDEHIVETDEPVDKPDENVDEPDETMDEQDEAMDESEEQITDPNEPMDEPEEQINAYNGVFKRVPDEFYSEKHVRDLSLKRAIALRSPCGTGKTKKVVSLLESLASTKDICVIFVTHRKALSQKAILTLPPLNGNSWVHYKDHKGMINVCVTPLVVIQYESLSRLTGLEDSSRRVVFILDEFNSICHQMHSDFGNVVMSQKRFCDLIRKSNHVIAMDGYLDQQRLDIFEKYLGQPAYLIHNQVKHRSHHVVERTRDQKSTTTFILNSLSQGKHIICPCMDKSLAEEIYTQTKQVFGETKHILLFTRDNPCEDGDVNESWKLADLVIHTSTIDCGISFEVNGHFDVCVCFFNNGSGPTYETATQMLSRSRDTSQFLICTSEKRFIDQPTEPAHILSEIVVKAELCDVQFYGMQSSHKRSRKWEDCNPYLMALVMTECVKRHSRNRFESSMLDLLQQDGAQVMREFKKFQSVTNTVQPIQATVEIPRKNLETTLTQLKGQYGFDGFDPTDSEAIKRYSRPAKRYAFENLKMLANNGPDFLSALAQRERDSLKTAAGLDACWKAGRYNSCVLTRAEVLTGVVGISNDILANRAASRFIEAMVGVPDPFNIPVLTEKEISDRLECQLITLTNKDDEEGKKSREVLCLSVTKKQEILDLFNQWVLCKPEIHTPRCMPGAIPLSLVKAVHLLDHVMEIMFDMRYKRQENSTRSSRKEKHKRNYAYEALESSDFTRCTSDITKPILPIWSTHVHNLTEPNILQVGKGVVQPSLHLNERQAGKLKLWDLPGIIPGHLGLKTKKRKTSA